MSIIAELLLSMRYELQDMAGNVYSPYVIMDQYNKGNKLLRKTILDYLPMQLAEEIADTVNAGESISMLKKPIKLIDVRINGRKIDKVAMTAIPDKTATGEPRAYYLLNTNTIKLYPIPEKSCAYEITYIPESVTMQDTDDSGYQTDIEQLLIRYVVATLTNGSFDLVSEYNANVGKMLGGIETGVTVIDGYYSDHVGRGDYQC
jgi:hypothetical protein